MYCVNTIRSFRSLSNNNFDGNGNQKVLQGLGKSTKRGIKKCANCGVYNGSRSTMCKNKLCGIILKDSGEKSKIDLEAVKLLTATEKQIYSVRVKDMGPDSRGFVQLPLLQLSTDNENSLFSEVALCFVDSCQNLFDNSILKCHEEDQNDNNLLCIHIKSALKSQSIASPLVFKKDVLCSFNLSNDLKENLFLIASENQHCFVQRVSKSVMAVKCLVSPKHPLGYLHCTFLSKNGCSYEGYCCSCGRYSGSDDFKEFANNVPKKCIHYYACLWAIASDNKLCHEFSYIIQKEASLFTINDCVSLSNTDNFKIVPLKIHKNVKAPDEVVSQPVSSTVTNKVMKKSRKKVLARKCSKILPKIFPIEIKVINEFNTANAEEEIKWSFLDWLSYVTESINLTMQFDNCGIVNILRFYIPETFFSHFTERIPKQHEAARGKMSVTYHIMNILHLKSIFDTSQVKLKISKKFVHSDDKGYIEYNENEEYHETYMPSFIFFLNVGESTVDESDNVNNAFIVEWIPSSGTVTKIGELKLHYKYGRKST